MQYCVECGTKWDDEVVFCDACGSPIYKPINPPKQINKIRKKTPKKKPSIVKQTISNDSVSSSNPYQKINEILSTGDNQYPYYTIKKPIPDEESTIQLKIVLIIGAAEVLLTGVVGIQSLPLTIMGFLLIILALFEIWLLFGIYHHENNKRLIYVSLLLINIIFSINYSNNISILTILIVLFTYWVLIVDGSTTRLFH